MSKDESLVMLDGIADITARVLGIIPKVQSGAMVVEGLERIVVDYDYPLQEFYLLVIKSGEHRFIGLARRTCLRYFSIRDLEAPGCMQFIMSQDPRNISQALVLSAQGAHKEEYPKFTYVLGQLNGIRVPDHLVEEERRLRVHLAYACLQVFTAVVIEAGLSKSTDQPNPLFEYDKLAARLNRFAGL